MISLCVGWDFGRKYLFIYLFKLTATSQGAVTLCPTWKREQISENADCDKEKHNCYMWNERLCVPTTENQHFHVNLGQCQSISVIPLLSIPLGFPNNQLSWLSPTRVHAYIPLINPPPLSKNTFQAHNLDKHNVWCDWIHFHKETILLILYILFSSQTM